MGGDAIFSGGSYQASVIACVFVHILAQRQLGWLGTVDDTPSAVWGETKGVGDDAHVEFRSETAAPIEIQTMYSYSAERPHERREVSRRPYCERNGGLGRNTDAHQNTR